MDYDKTNIATVYDSARDHSPETLQRWLDVFSAVVPKEGVSRVVDLGCGTGRFSESLASHFAADVIGLDPSESMLEQAREKTVRPGVVFQQASGETLPLDDQSADMVYLSMVYHHLRDPRRTARECHRVLRPRGHVCLRNTTVDAIESFPYLRFFPAIRSVIEAQLPERGQVVAAFEQAGFRTVAQDIVTQPTAADWADFAEKMTLRADSFLARVPDDAFDKGIAALRSFAQGEQAGQSVLQDIDYFVFQS